ncbi:deoxycytidine triphosphate deaminase [Metallosphaera yellowstonensis MK1]|jgi:dCTP deaminase|uniref:dCTP deaminase n=1 Tax=Metallosphaera yellowstonensis MK1 TaxID=671065 RepID=H2C697_9CREN|nr:dCTP deaminase [Metallosphaera yellowstonensis]EHP69324.1 deoxycytidine triphosphate deaminase [Metallosphaera yellowstonensis MK1]
MILGDRDLKYYLEKGWIVIDPLTEDSIRENGVDMRVGGEIARFKRTEELFEEGKDLSEFFQKEIGEEFVIKPNEHVLLVTEEYLRLPSDIMAFVNLRSSFARLGLFVPPTIVDAGFEGQLTIEVMGSAFPVKIKRGTRFLHLIFAKTLSPVEKPYQGKYQGQRGVTLPKFRV